MAHDCDCRKFLPPLQPASESVAAVNVWQMYDYAYMLTRRERALAEDLVQEAFMAAAGKWTIPRRWSDDRRLAWLLRVTANIAIDGFRRNGTARSKQADIWDHYRPVEPDTARQALSGLELRRCWEVIERLPKRQHMAAMLQWRVG
jgi:DNA-directed RNA polymerase specialized sigma24 family protein